MVGYFKNRVNAKLIWQVPKGAVSVFTGKQGARLKKGSLELDCYIKAKKLISNDQIDQAIPLLEKCAAANHPESKLLLSHIFRRQNNERWKHYATTYNQHLSTTRAVPAACYYPESKTIAIHHHLYECKTPQFVLKYLLFHECCHQLVDCSNSTPHPEAFMQWEVIAPNRNRALDWLEKKGFPTLRTANEN